MPIKPSVTFGRSTWTAPNLVCHAMFNSIAVDNIECEKANLFNNGLPSKSVLIFTDLEDKIIFRGDGNDMMHAVLFQCLLTKRLDNEINIDGIKVEVEQQGKAKHKKIISKLWFCCIKGDDKLLEYIPNENFDDKLNSKKSLLEWPTSYIIVIDFAEWPAYLHQNCIIVQKHMWSNKVFSEVAKIVTFVSKVVVFMYVTMGPYGYIALVRRKKRKKRDSGGHLEMSTTVWSSKFKQWDPGKICAKCNFYNLEDKVGFKGKGIVMNPPYWIGPNRS
ncbi:unnamed protein product [Trifolium pratense]|nr:unnamed protein product [Trifolium pratense]